MPDTSKTKTEQKTTCKLTTGKLMAFTKIEHTLFSFPLFFAGAYLGNKSGGAITWQTMLWILLAGTGGRTLGMTMNRILDRDIDAQNPRTADRELPRGAMNLQSAYLIAVAGLIVYLLACYMLGEMCLLLSPIPVIFLILYSLLKRFTSSCHFCIGICLALAPMGAYVATSNQLPFASDIMLLAVYTICWISGYDMIYALQDLEFDRQYGVHSLPAALGYNGTLLVAATAHILAIIAASGLLLLGGGGLWAQVALGVAVITYLLSYVPAIPLAFRFFPLSAIAGAAGAMIPLLTLN